MKLWQSLYRKTSTVDSDKGRKADIKNKVMLSLLVRWLGTYFSSPLKRGAWRVFSFVAQLKPPSIVKPGVLNNRHTYLESR
jgi:hypothetical protein